MKKEAFMENDRQKRRRLYLLFYALIETYVGYAEYHNQEQYRENKRMIMEMMEGEMGGL